MNVKVPLHTLPVSARPALSFRGKLAGLLFCIVFDVGCLIVNALQFCLLPLRILPTAQHLYKDGIQQTKGAFGCLLILMCQWFAPTAFKVTFETEGQGAFTEEEIESCVVRDTSGKIIYLDLPTKFVLIANHQVYADWWYNWILLYFIGPNGVHKNCFITLKKSLRWIPIIGWGMQFFNFIFLARSWASDRLQLASHLSTLGKEAERDHDPFAFILYPEGTLVSKDTRPISRKFAEKIGETDLKNMLLPRSTGLHYSLRSLAPRCADLRLLDLTVVYPGIPPGGYGQSYYTLRSIFFDSVPPPCIHVHLRSFKVSSQVPIGDLSKSDPSAPPDPGASVEVDIPEEEAEKFTVWLRSLWRDKDESISQFFDKDSFSSNHDAINIPVRLW
ncbi:acyltransferase-domain-containing protein [Mycena floridula]|nr:acyltransferase-domain-containing protein [Mycena floridula]